LTAICDDPGTPTYCRIRALEAIHRIRRDERLGRRRGSTQTRRIGSATTGEGFEVSRALEMPAEELVEAIEAAAARGDAGAETSLGLLIDALLATGDLDVISRLAASRYLPR
jgi:hypothetical protein